MNKPLTDGEIEVIEHMLNADIKVVKPSFVFSSKREIAALELIDGVYEIVEMWKAETPHQKKWKEEWLRKAKELGANPE